MNHARGGQLEESESPEQAVAREVYEETHRISISEEYFERRFIADWPAA